MKQGTWLVAGLLLLGSGSVLAEPPDREGPPEGPEAVTEAQEKEVLDFVRTKAPPMFDDLSRLRERRPEAFRHRMREAWRMYQDPDVRERFIRQAQARQKVQRLKEAYRRADDKGKEAVRKDLEAGLSELFDADLGMKELHIKKMQDELAKLKDRIASRRTKKADLVKKRLERMTGDDEDEW